MKKPEVLKNLDARGVLSALLAAGALVYFAVSPGGSSDDKLPSQPAIHGREIKPDEPATVLNSRTIPGDGSRLVLRQCLAGQAPRCNTETYDSDFPDPAIVYPDGSTIMLQDVTPPMQLASGR